MLYHIVKGKLDDFAEDTTDVIDETLSKIN